ncbi:MAG TPA: hypothetical protein VM077_05845 [Candidatus Limnocylindrales bacterium]|nr:hypothetical protein [Candidatus Limnocylindrales bacterium]
MLKKSKIKSPKSRIRDKIGKNILLGLLFLASFSVPFLVQGKTDHKVTLSEKGFSEKEITIKKGQKVTWTIGDDGVYWPASDIHPLHNSYPDSGGCLGSKLDACRFLKRGEKFSFVFEKVGVWGIHDHLNPKHTMNVRVEEGPKNNPISSLLQVLNPSKNKVIKVYSPGNYDLSKFSPNQIKIVKQILPSISSEEGSAKAYDICMDLSGSKFREKQHCYSEVFYIIASNTDQRKSFRTLSNLQKKDTSTRVCHLIAHGIGWAMYEKDPDNWQDAIGKMSPECSYGGIHGIVERQSALSGQSIDEKNIKTICDKNKNWACYHAIGHIVLVQAKNDLVVATDLCSEYSEKMPKISCLNGVFMENMIGQNLEQHGLVTYERRKHFADNLEEFEKLCSSQVGDLARSCWTEIIHASVTKYKGNVDEIYGLCDRAQTREAAMGCRRHALAEILPLKKFEPKEVTQVCERPISDDSSFEKECYLALATIAMSNAPSKIDSVLSYCMSLPQEYQPLCLDKISKEVSLLRSKDPEKALQICQKISIDLKYVCESNGKSSLEFSDR